jgi:hypothetical protein
MFILGNGIVFAVRNECALQGAPENSPSLPWHVNRDGPAPAAWLFRLIAGNSVTFSGKM